MRRRTPTRSTLLFSPARSLCFCVFQTELGWMALAGSDGVVCQATFPRASKAAARAALDAEIRARAVECDWFPMLVERMRQYAAGAPDDFADVRIDFAHLTPFQSRIVRAARAIPYGQSRTYGQVAAAAGNARAARAVGNTMKLNRFAWIVPCHRVVHRGGDGSRPNGPALARRKLRRLESADAAR